ncbi:MAG: glycine cleavage system protein GcvH [Desulfatiglandaceae bacterium]
MLFGEVDIPEELNYTKKHLWVKIQDGLCTLGWTDYIQKNAGDVNYVELPPKGTALEVDQDFGTIETSKWVDRLYSPVNGQVMAVNNEVIKTPELVNKAPFTQGWFVRVGIQSGTGSHGLLSPVEYLDYIKTCEEQ